ncbi:MAG TPA: FAD-dependent oxidoreductase [Candidatus Tumulicola sp.]|nr:FAD-dependent oxidoreductase [Candidatus Tumulicola sp.]
MADQTYDIVIVGGSLGGCAAALSAGSSQYTVCLLEASGWLGGQYSAQGVTKPDESSYTPTVGSTATYRGFQHNVRAFYRSNYRLSPSGQGQPTFNPGGGYPGFATQPRVAHQVLLQQLQALSNVHVRLNTSISSAQAEGDCLQSVVAVGSDGVQTTYAAKYFLDATDLGDLLPIAGVEYNLGAESKDDTRESAAPAEARSDWIQPITVVVALERRPDGEDNRIVKPPDYDALKATQKYTILDGYIKKMFQPGVDMWGYRRHIYAANFNDPAFPCDFSMLNMGANDFQGGTLPTGSAEGDAAVIAGARQASLAYVYWLQTECPRDDGGGVGYQNLKVRGDEFGTDDGTAAQPYIRESRRIKGQYRIVQQDLDQASNAGPRGKNYDDSCGIGFYGGLDIHGNNAVGMGQQFISIKPFEIPLRALVPIRVKNVLAACKNLGVTHITNGAYRLHPVEWNIGEAAAALAVFALDKNARPADVPGNQSLLRSLQKRLLARGVPLFWWTDITNADQAFAAVHLVGVAGIMSGEGTSMNFQPNDDFGDDAKAAVESNLGKKLNWPPSDMTRSQAALWIVQQLNW